MSLIADMGYQRVSAHTYNTYTNPGNKRYTSDDDRAYAAQRAVAGFEEQGGSFFVEGLREIRDRVVVAALCGAVAVGAIVGVAQIHRGQ